MYTLKVLIASSLLFAGFTLMAVGLTLPNFEVMSILATAGFLMVLISIEIVNCLPKRAN